MAAAPLIPAEGPTLGLHLSEATPVHAALVAARAPAPPDYDMHYGVELGVVMSGRMRRHWRTWQTQLAPGQVWYCGIWERHGWEVVEAPCEHLVLVILPEALLGPGLPMAHQDDLLAPFRVAPEQRPRSEAATRQEVLGLAQQIVARLAPHPAGDPLSIRLSGASNEGDQLWLRLLAIELLLLLQQGWTAPAAGGGRGEGLDSFSGAADLVFSTRQMVTTAGAAAACGMSASAFSRSFKRLTGLSFAKFALRHRLSGAAAQLLGTHDTLKAIAEDWGFTDDSHFHRCFVRHYGCSPGAYRGKRRSPSGRTG